MAKPLWIAALAALLPLVAACGGNVDVLAPDGSGTAGAGGSGTGGNGSGGGNGGAGGSLPPQCQVATAQVPPYATTFRFVNPTGQVLCLHQGCNLDFSVTACADGYVAPLVLWADCSVDCSDPPGGGCIACGACWEGGVPVDPGGVLEASWTGLTYTFGQNADGCPCHTGHKVAPSKYRLLAPVYETEEAAELGQPIWQAGVDFQLPAPGGRVDVPLAGML
ncbi:MAG: hypothetical protein HY744_15530 [Deltaproteobacteria bacterium]|nr:hypothetical protein [Deltaproteobacteria bacterium]